MKFLSVILPCPSARGLRNWACAVLVPKIVAARFHDLNPAEQHRTDEKTYGYAAYTHVQFRPLLWDGSFPRKELAGSISLCCRLQPSVAKRILKQEIEMRSTTFLSIATLAFA